MKALKNIDVAFLPMNLPYTMPPDEAADCVKAFKPKIVYPYHYRGPDPKEFADGAQGQPASTSACATGTGAGTGAPYRSQFPVPSSQF